MNPFFQSFQSNKTSPQYSAGQSNGQIPAPPTNLNQLLTEFAQRLMPFGMSPEQIVRQKIQSGEMTQAQFDQCAQIANSWLGVNGPK